jgi:hypothetical protein
MNWKEFVRKQSWPNMRYHPRIYLDGRKTTKNLRILGDPAEILTGHFPNTSQVHYCFSQHVP